MSGQNQLLIAIFCNNLDEISSLLPNININYIYSGPFNNKTALEISCCEYISTIQQSTIQLLIQNGAEYKKALFYAACENNIKIVCELIKHEVSLKNNPILLLLIKYIHDNKKNEESYLKIVEILLTKIQINLEDDTGCTAIYLAAKYDYKHLIELMLNTKYKEIDLDNFKHNISTTARDILQLTYPGKLPEPLEKSSTEINLELLLKNIRQRQETVFLKNYHQYCQRKIENIHKDNTILLLYAVEKGLINLVRYFLYINVDANTILDKCAFPLKYASVRGYYEIVKVLLLKANEENEIIKYNINISLIELVKTKFEENIQAKINHKHCLKLLLENTNLDFSFRDESGNTVCHYASMYQSPEIILMLLQNGGSLASKNNDKMTIELLTPDILEKHFDDCIEFVHKSADYMPQTVKINFISMLPDKRNYISKVETNLLQYISNQKELKQLLHHPVIDMFLFLKWQRVKKFILFNLLLYIIFMVLVFLYIYTKTVVDPEKLYFKWICSKIIKVSLIVFWFILIFREVSQIFLFGIDYIKQYENWIEACLFTATGVLLFKECQTMQLKNQLSALIIVTSSVELMLLSGRQFKIFFVSSIVLQTVSTTLFKWLSSYFILIGSFSFGFYYIFHGQRFFKNMYISIFKTIVMITGEFELENFEFADNYLIGPVLFILFVFLVNIVLLGVCTALAIHDIQLIMNNAETKMQIVQIQHIVYWEKTLYTSQIYYHFGNWFQSFLKIKLFQKDPNIIIQVLNNDTGYHIVDNEQKLKIDTNILKKIMAKDKISNKCNNIKEYPSLNENYFYSLRQTLKSENYSDFTAVDIKQT